MNNILLKVDKNLKNEQILWRYMDLSKFISLLSTKTLWLAKSSTFKDQQEGKFPSAMQNELDAIYKTFGEDKRSEIKTAHDFKRFLCNNAFISCWHKNIEENMVMWEIYGQDTNLVAIQTTVASLKESIKNAKIKGINFILKEIDYSGHSQAVDTHYTTPFFVKRPHFRHEDEARILLSTYSAYNPSDNTPAGYPCSVDTGKLIDKVLVHPDSNQWFIDAIKSISKQYNILSPVSQGMYGNK